MEIFEPASTRGILVVQVASNEGKALGSEESNALGSGLSSRL
jgi:hypothetical protein